MKPKKHFSIGLTQARDILGELVNRVQYGKERIVFERRGQPAIALVPMEDLEKLDSEE